MGTASGDPAAVEEKPSFSLADANKTMEKLDDSSDGEDDESYAAFFPMTAKKEQGSPSGESDDGVPASTAIENKPSFSLKVDAKPFVFNPNATSFTFTPAAAKVEEPAEAEAGATDGEAAEANFEEYNPETYAEGAYDDGNYDDQYGYEEGAYEGDFGYGGYLDENGVLVEGGGEYDDSYSSYNSSYNSTPNFGPSLYGAGGIRSAPTSPFAPPTFLGAHYEQMGDFSGFNPGRRKKPPITLDNQVHPFTPKPTLSPATFHPDPAVRPSSRSNRTWRSIRPRNVSFRRPGRMISPSSSPSRTVRR